MADPYTSYAPTITYSDWGQRAVGYLIDVSPVIVVLIILDRISVALSAVGWLLSLGWSLYNRWYLGGTTGQSIGKKVMNIRLVSEQTGQPIGMLMAFVRDICHILDSLICYVGWLFRSGTPSGRRSRTRSSRPWWSRPRTRPPGQDRAATPA